jgi:hypothetical protein
VPVVPPSIGSPVAFVKVPLEGVPKAGVTSVGLLESTTEPVPVDDVTPVPPLATGRVPVTWLVRLTFDRVPPSVKSPVEVTVPVRVMPLTVPVPPTLVTVPAPLPAPIAVRKEAASSEETVLSALKRGNVTALGLATVKRFAPSVVAPRLVRAADAVVAAVPPRAIGRVPVVPPSIGRPVAFVRVALEGVPKAGVTSVGLLDRTTFPVPVEEVTPVPPLATGSVPVTSDVRSMMLEDTITKSEPFQAISAFSPLVIVTPVVGPDPTTFTPKPPVVALITTYALDWAGAVIVRSAAREPVQSSTALRAWLAAPFVVDSVTSTSVLSAVVPATAESSSPVIESLTVVPHVPAKSPVVGNANPNNGEKFVTAMAVPYIVISTSTQSGDCELPTFCQSGVWLSSIVVQ